MANPVKRQKCSTLVFMTRLIFTIITKKVEREKTFFMPFIVANNMSNFVLGDMVVRIPFTNQQIL